MRSWAELKTLYNGIYEQMVYIQCQWHDEELKKKLTTNSIGIGEFGLGGNRVKYSSKYSLFKTKSKTKIVFGYMYFYDNRLLVFNAWPLNNVFNVL